MKPRFLLFLLTLFATALAARADTGPSLSLTAVSGTIGSPGGPGSILTITVTIANSAVSSTASGTASDNDYPGGSFDFAPSLGAAGLPTINLAVSHFVQVPIIAAGSSGSVVLNYVVPTCYSEAGTYTLSVYGFPSPTTTATATTALSGSVSAIQLLALNPSNTALTGDPTNPSDLDPTAGHATGSGYTAVPSVIIGGGTAPAGGTLAAATALLAANAGNISSSGEPVLAVNVTSGGSGYTAPPTVQIKQGANTSASAQAYITGSLKATLGSGGSGYVTPPLVVIWGEGAGGNAFYSATVAGGAVSAITQGSGGSGYTLPISQSYYATPPANGAAIGSEVQMSAYLTGNQPAGIDFAGGGSDTNALGSTLMGGTSVTGSVTIAGNHDLVITDLHYPAGMTYTGGPNSSQIVPMSLTYTNRPVTEGTFNTAFAPSVTSVQTFRIEVHLSTNPTYGDGDDFLLYFQDVGGPVQADGVEHTITWNQQLPTNFAGSYYIVAKIDSLNATNDITASTTVMNGNNVWYDETDGVIDGTSGNSANGDATRLSLEPATFPFTYLVSSTTAGVSGNNYSDHPATTMDGRYTAFASDATNLAGVTGNGNRQIYVYDNQALTSKLISQSLQGAMGNAGSDYPSVNSGINLPTGTTSTAAELGAVPSGEYVAFQSDANNLVVASGAVPGDTNGFTDVFRVNTISSQVDRVSLGGTAAAPIQANNPSFQPVISADGRFVVFKSTATNLVTSPAVTSSTYTHIYLHDCTTGLNQLVDQAGGVVGNGAATNPALSQSADGTAITIAFSSAATNLLAPVVTTKTNVYAVTVQGITTASLPTLGAPVLVSHIPGNATQEGDNNSDFASVSVVSTSGSTAGDAYVAYASNADNLVPNVTNGVSNVYVASSTNYGASYPTTVMLSASNGLLNGTGSNQGLDNSLPGYQIGSFRPSISASGQYVAFASVDYNLMPGTIQAGEWEAYTLNQGINIYRVDRDVGATGTFDTSGNTALTKASVNSFGYDTMALLGTPSTASSDVSPVISGDGRWVAFPSDADSTGGLAFGHTNILPLDTNGFRDVFLYDSRLAVLSQSPSTAPTVSINSIGTVYVNATTPISVSSTASVLYPNGEPVNIATVNVYVNGQSIGTGSGNSVSINWTPTTQGTYTISAEATDIYGNVGVSNTEYVTVQTKSNTVPPQPSLSVNVPVGGQPVNSPLVITATATEGAGIGNIASVQFLADGTLLGTVTSYPYTFTWTPTALGNYQLTVVAVDNNGNQNNSTATVVDVVVPPAGVGPPTVSFLSPSTLLGVSSGLPTTLEVSATSASGNVVSVQFSANQQNIGGPVTTYPFLTQWTPSSPGIYVLTATALDNFGNSTTVSETVTATPLGAPNVSITSVLPTSGTNTYNAGTPVTVLVGATTPTLGIGNVTLLANGVAVGAEPASGTVYTYTAATGTWTPTLPSVTPVDFVYQINYAAVWSFTFTPSTSGVFSLTAEATDLLGNTSTSAPTVVTFVSPSAPTVSVSAPTAGSSFFAGTPITLSAKASAAGPGAGSSTGTVIAGIEFLVNGIPVNIKSISDVLSSSDPYQTTWTPTAAGTYLINAIALDSAGNTTTSASVTVTITDPSAPTVAISNIFPGSSVSAGTPMQLTASAGSGAGTVTSVTFYAVLNGGSGATPLGTVSALPYTLNWTPTLAGTYTVTATATNTYGATATSAPQTVTVTASNLPTVAFTSPVALATLSVNQPVNVVATAAPGAGTTASIVSVEFLENGTLLSTASVAPYVFAWTPTQVGTVQLEGLVTDSLGNISSASELVSVTSGTPPSVSVVTPAAAAALALGTPTTVTASATANTGNITTVKFLANGVAIGSASAAPFSVSWTPVAPGGYALTALATDSVGNQTLSSPVTVSVNAGGTGATGITLTAPAGGTHISLGASVPLVAAPLLAPTSTATIASVQFFANGALVKGGTVTSAPYTVNWTPTASGAYSLTSVVTDSLGGTVVSAPVSVTVNAAGAAPVVSLANPVAGASILSGSSVDLIASASSANGPIVQVQFLVNGAPLTASGNPASAAPYIVAWSPTVAGSYAVSALATDSAGVSTVSSPVNVTVSTGTPPVVAVTNPGAGGASLTLGSGLLLTAAASSGTSAITSVQFQANGIPLVGGSLTAPPYALSWLPVSAGSYAITAVATDAQGNVSVSAATTVAVTAAAAPTITLSVPATSPVVAGSSVPLQTSVTAGSGTVTSVEFLANGIALTAASGTNPVTTAPYTVSWKPVAAGSYTLTAVVTNSAGLTTISNAVTLSAVAAPAPVVVLTAPANGATVPAGEPVQLSATASDADGTVSSLQFEVNGVVVATSSTFPYSGTWTPLAAGTYSVTAVALDSFGNVTASAPASVTATAGVPPSVTLGAVPAATVGSVQTLVATLSLPTSYTGSVTQVQFYSNGVLLGTASAFPYVLTWVPSAPGNYALTAVVTDNLGNQATSPVVSTSVGTGTPPTVTLTAPANGSTLSVNQAVTLTATAGSTTGTIASVQFLENGVLLAKATSFPYTTTWTPVSSGKVVLEALATDNLGNVSTSISTVTVSSGTAPAVTFLPSLAGATLPVNTTQQVTVNAVPSSGTTIASVQFQVNGVVLGTVTASPYTVAWTPVSAGSYTITAVATDNIGDQTSASEALSVTVGTPPTVAITSPAIVLPATSVPVTLGAPVTVTANAAAGAGMSASIVSVQFFENGVLFGKTSAFPYTVSWTPTGPGSYVLTALATDSLGNQTTSAAVAATVTSGSAPTVTLTSPASIALGTSATLLASPLLPSGSTASIASVQFYANGVLLPGGDVTQPTYGVSWTPTASGPYVLTAVVTDSIGNTATSSPVSVNVTSNLAPTVSIATPATGTSVNAGTSVELGATVSSSNGPIAVVQFLINGAPLAVSGNPAVSAPYVLKWTPTAAGSYAVSAIATDSAGLSTVSAAVTVNVNAGNPPTVSITNPGVGGASFTLGAGLVLSASASSVSSTVKSVQFYANNVPLTGGLLTTPPYSVGWVPTAAGSYTLTALATDALGNVAVSSGVLATVTSGSAPTVSLLAPASGSYVAGTSVSVDAAVTAGSGTVSSVQFLANGIPLSAASGQNPATAAPYAIIWKPAAAGSYSLTAVVTNSAGQSVTSAPIAVTIAGAPAPAVALTAPANGATVTAGAPVQLSATASDADGTVTSVQFEVNGVVVATSSTFPYSGTWTPTAAGTYAVTAVAVDSFGNVTTSAVATVTASAGVPPSVTLGAVGTTTVGSVQTLVATLSLPASYTGSVTQVQFYSNGTLLGTASAFPYVLSWVPSAPGNYALTAVVTDNLGNQVTSPIVAAVVGTGTPPSVALVSPGNGLTLQVNKTIQVSATATSSTGTIASVQFLANGVLIAKATSFPYTVSWTPVSSGIVLVEALATDNLGNVSTSTSTVTVVTGTAPTVSFLAPLNAATLPVNTTQQVTVNAVPAAGTSLSSVEFLINGVALGTVTASPYTVAWTPVSAGSYTLTALATDNLGDQTSQVETVNVTVGTAPTVAITSPAPTASLIVGSPATVTATAAVGAGMSASIVSVQFLENGVLIGKTSAFPYTVSWTPSGPGAYVLTALATDSLGNQTTSAAVAVTVGSGSAPTVSITSPASNASILLGTSTTIVALPVLPSGSAASVASVEFYANGVLLPGGTVTTPPYSVTWTPSAAGAFPLTAVVTDSVGNTATSAAVTVAVTSLTAPAVSIISPATGYSAISGSTVTLSASATPAAGVTIAQVQFLINGLPLVAAGNPAKATPYTVNWTPTSAGSYAVSAIATDSAGVSTVSSPIAVSVTTGAPPTVSLTNPGAGGALLNLGSGLVVTATASSSASTIKSVQFFANGSLLPGGTVTTAPYTLGWVPSGAGSYTLTAVATDALGNVTTSSGVSVIVSPVGAPTVALTSPQSPSAAVVGAAVTVTASASTPVGSISQVEFLANGLPISPTTGANPKIAAPYSITWVPTAAGTYLLSAVATNSAGLSTVSSSIQVTVSGTPAPAVALTSPVTGSATTAGTPILLTATASDALGTISQVQFDVNGVLVVSSSALPYSASWTPTAAGTYTLTAVAIDSFGNVTTSAPSTLTVNAGSGPNVAFVTPASGSSATVNGILDLVVSASSPTGTISGVQFFANGISLGTVSTYPYVISWAPTSPGTVVLTAVATDNAGNQSTATATLLVDGGLPPLVTLATPANGSALLVNQPVTVIATATAQAGTINEVDYLANGVLIGKSTTYPFSITWTPLSAGSVVLEAIAQDSLGNIATSTSTVDVIAGAPPSVSFASPGAGSSLPANTATLVAINAVVGVGTQASIVSVQLLENGVTLTTLKATPYSYSWTPPAAGSYTLTALATDSLGNQTTATESVSVTAGNPPTVSFTSPALGSQVLVNTPTTISVNAAVGNNTFGNSIQSVELLANGGVLATLKTPPYSYSWTPTSAGTYVLTALVTDAVGNQVTAAQSVAVISGQPPSIVLSNPPSGSALTVGSAVPVIASVTNGSGTVKSIQFLANGLSIGTVTGLPYSVAWTPAVPGSYVLTAVVTDSLNNQGTSPALAVTAVTGSAPSISIVSPLANAVIALGNSATLAANVSLPLGSTATVASVQFFANGAPMAAGLVKTAPFSMSWTPTAAGTYQFTAIVTDSIGNQTTSPAVTVAVTSSSAPAVTVTTPTSGSAYVANSVINLAAAAVANNGTIAQVEFLINGLPAPSTGGKNPITAAPYDLSWTPTAAGSYAISAVATDTAGFSTVSAPVTVTVTNAAAPSVAIINPASGGSSIALGSGLEIAAVASSTVSTIKTVQFFANGVLIPGSSTVPPYDVSWVPSGAGTYTLTAQATDALGNISTSNGVSVTVTSVLAPVVSFSSPASGADFVAGSAIPISVSASTATGNVTQVEILANGIPIVPTGGGTNPLVALPYSLTWTPKAAGTYALTAIAANSAGLTTVSAPTTITVVASPAPTVSLASPANGSSTVAGTTVQLSASAGAYAGGTITSVQFEVDGLTVATASGASTRLYTGTWMPTTPGSYTVTAVATDSFGNTTTSSPAIVTVTATVPPSLVLLTPAANATVLINQPLMITATVTPGTGAVTGVQFSANGIAIGSPVTTYPYSITWTPTTPGLVVISAEASDNQGNESAPVQVGITVVTGTPPLVSITNPLNGGGLIVGQPVPVTATATAQVGTMASVQFYANGAVLGGPVKAFPYTTSWTPALPGTYLLTALATDSLGDQSLSSGVTVTVGSGSAPIVAMVNPTPNAVISLGNSSELIANATALVGQIANVQFYANSIAVSTQPATTAPYEFSWKPASAGIYQVWAVATDTVGNTSVSSVVTVSVTSTAAPTVTLTSPAPGASAPYLLGATVPLTATASGGNGTITQVEFLINGALLSVAGNPVKNAPYTLNWTPTATGKYTITAIASDSAGDTTVSAPATVTVNQANPPVVSITSPASGTSLPLGTGVEIAAAVSSTTTTISTVQFLANGLLLPGGNISITPTTPPILNWVPSGAGVYTITAVATDALGNETTSAGVTVTVTATTAPQVVITSPGPGSEGPVGEGITIEAQPTTNVGTITQIEFLVNGVPVNSSSGPNPVINPVGYPSITWTPTAVGTYVLTAVASNSAGLSTVSAPVVYTAYPMPSPVVTLSLPSDGTTTTVGYPVHLVASAGSASETSASLAVTFFVNGIGLAGTGTNPYQAVWTPTVPGTYTIVAEVIDVNQSVGISNSATVTVNPDLPPSVSITTPSTGTVVAVNNGLTLVASASSTTSTIQQVEFLANGVLINTPQTQPGNAGYTTGWNPTSAGVYTLQAVAIDVAGQATTSASVLVDVAPAGANSATTVYTGNYVGPKNATGKFSLVAVDGTEACLIAYATNSTAVVIAPDVALSASGALSGNGVSGTTSVTGASGTFNTGNDSFVGAIPQSTGSTVPVGYYTGSISGQATSQVYGIVGADGSIALSVSSGTFSDAGGGSLDLTGAFRITTSGANTVTGQVDLSTGFLTATLLGGPGGSITAAPVSGGLFSDGLMQNLSTRGTVGTGNSLLIAGFNIGGTASKQVLIRAVGPTLGLATTAGGFAVPGALQASQLTLVDTSGNTIASDSAWNSAPVTGSSTVVSTVVPATSVAMASVGAFALAPGSLDSALIATLPPGSYTAKMAGVGSDTGVALVELYDMDSLPPFSSQKLLNVSTRGTAGNGELLIAGFVIDGTTPKRVLIRAVGPTLGLPTSQGGFGMSGALSAPFLRLNNGAGTEIRENTAWQVGNDAAMVAAAASTTGPTATGAFPLVSGSADSALLITLPPGAYTAEVSGVGSASGVALVEVYEIP